MGGDGESLEQAPSGHTGKLRGETGGPRRLEHVFGAMCKTVNFLRSCRFIAQTSTKGVGLGDRKADQGQIF